METKPTPSYQQNERLEISNDEKDSLNRSNGLETPEKSIGWVGSFFLLSNNICGPAMMGLPHVLQSAGFIPVFVSIIVVYLCSSINATMLAESIALIPGNKQFRLPINFSSSFSLIVGEKFYPFVEFLFLLSCMVFACTSLVETAQSLDQFIASFLIGKTYALQLVPTIQFVEWSSVFCHAASETQKESTLEECTPFNNDGPLVISLGYCITTILFLPFGRGHLKETIIMQYISFIFFIILSIQFYLEFSYRLLTKPIVTVPLWVG